MGFSLNPPKCAKGYCVVSPQLSDQERPLMVDLSRWPVLLLKALGVWPGTCQAHSSELSALLESRL